jgi:hypothetical protein
MGITIGTITIGSITVTIGITGIIVGGRMATGIATGRVTPHRPAISEATAAYPGRNHFRDQTTTEATGRKPCGVLLPPPLH